MTLVVTSLLLVVVCGVAAALLAPWLLRRTPEPALEPDEVKTPYADLATWRFSVAAGVWAAALATAAVIGVEPDRVGPWLIVAIVGALASVVDVATTWIPRRWVHVGWLLAGLSVAWVAWKPSKKMNVVAGYLATIAVLFEAAALVMSRNTYRSPWITAVTIWIVFGAYTVALVSFEWIRRPPR